jgi:tetratricopeptide (TPR) repeat protein
LTADAHYGVGTAYLFKAFNTKSGKLVKTAISHLEQAVKGNPLDERSHFRLGFAYQIMKNTEEAVLEFAKAAAIGGANSQMALQYLEKTYTTLHGNTDGMQQLIQEQKSLLGLTGGI